MLIRYHWATTSYCFDSHPRIASVLQPPLCWYGLLENVPAVTSLHWSLVQAAEEIPCMVD
jgi:hypothetical protein